MEGLSDTTDGLSPHLPLQGAKFREAGEVPCVRGDDFNAAAGGAGGDQRIVGQARAADALVAVLVRDAVEELSGAGPVALVGNQQPVRPLKLQLKLLEDAVVSYTHSGVQLFQHHRGSPDRRRPEPTKQGETSRPLVAQ